MTPEDKARYRWRAELPDLHKWETGHLIQVIREDYPKALDALDAMEAERDEARSNYQFMVEKAADGNPGLDGYRKLGQKAAEAEQRAEAAEARVKQLDLMLDNEEGENRKLVARVEEESDIANILMAQRDEEELKKKQCFQAYRELEAELKDLGLHNLRQAAELAAEREKVATMEQHLGIKNECSTHNFQTFVEQVATICDLREALENVKSDIEDAMPVKDDEIRVAILDPELLITGIERALEAKHE